MYENERILRFPRELWDRVLTGVATIIRNVDWDMGLDIKGGTSADLYITPELSARAPR